MKTSSELRVRLLAQGETTPAASTTGGRRKGAVILSQ